MIFRCVLRTARRGKYKQPPRSLANARPPRPHRKSQGKGRDGTCRRDRRRSSKRHQFRATIRTGEPNWCAARRHAGRELRRAMRRMRGPNRAATAPAAHCPHASLAHRGRRRRHGNRGVCNSGAGSRSRNRSGHARSTSLAPARAAVRASSTPASAAWHARCERFAAARNALALHWRLPRGRTRNEFRAPCREPVRSFVLG